MKLVRGTPDLAPVRAVMRPYFAAMAVTTVLPLLVIAALIFSNDARTFLGDRVWLTIVFLMIVPVSLIILSTLRLVARMSEIARIAREHHGLLCRDCMYAMPEGVSQCPECGLTQDMERTVADWHALTHRQRPPSPPQNPTHPTS